MKIIEQFSQKANFAVIAKFRNSCNISEKWIYKTFDDIDQSIDSDDVFGEKVSVKTEKSPSHVLYVLPEKDRNNRKYFYCDTDTRYARLKLFFDKIGDMNVITTEDDSLIRKSIADPFSSIDIYTVERCVTVFENKITLKYDMYVKRKRLNNKFFTKTKSKTLISINTDNGNFYLASIGKKGKTNTKRIRKNDFFTLKHQISAVINDNFLYFIKSNDNYKNELKAKFNDDEFLRFVGEKLKLSLGDTKGYLPSFTTKTSSPDIHSMICEYFAAKRNIKLPNDYMYWLTYLYPTEKFLKKNDRKLILASLDLIGLKNKYTNKIFHKYQNIDLYSYKKIVDLFGDGAAKYLGNIPEVLFEKGSSQSRKDNSVLLNNLKYVKNEPAIFNYLLSDGEKENLIKCLIDFKEPFSYSTVNMIYDHISMISKIVDYGIDFKFNARSVKELDNEHLELTKIISAIKKGWVTQYVFNDMMVNDIETPVELIIEPPQDFTTMHGSFQPIKLTFYPYILKREEEYKEEGAFMHHCVATYTEKSKSIIISIRNEDKSDRVTCEFNCQDGRLIQARHFCNKQPPADMLLAVDQLSDKAKRYARLGMLHALEHQKVPVIVNGVEIIQKQPTPNIFNDILFDF
jgi:hypothetical protein